MDEDATNFRRNGGDTMASNDVINANHNMPASVQGPRTAAMLTSVTKTRNVAGILGLNIRRTITCFAEKQSRQSHASSHGLTAS